MGTTEQRFALDIRLAASGDDEPGLVLDNSGHVVLIKPDGSRVDLTTGGGGGGYAWIVEDDDAGTIVLGGSATPEAVGSILVSAPPGGIAQLTSSDGETTYIQAQDTAINLSIAADDSALFLNAQSADESEGTAILLAPDNLQISAGQNNTGMTFADQQIQIAGIPTSDPAVAGALWIDTTSGNVLKVSQG